MKINEKNTINSIQQEFQKHFPYLKIEFYKETHSEGEGSTKSHIINGDLTISEVQSAKKSGSIDISGEMKVSEVENAMAEVLNLGAQVFRKSGNVWLQTTTTDELTLNAQIKKAKEHNEEIEEEIPNSMDRQDLE